MGTAQPGMFPYRFMVAAQATRKSGGRERILGVLMAILHVGLAANDFQFLPNLMDADGVGAVTTTTASTFAYTSSGGNSVTVTGTGFTYGGSVPQSGTIMSLIVKDSGGETLFEVAQISSGLAAFYADIFGQDGSGF